MTKAGPNFPMQMSQMTQSEDFFQEQGGDLALLALLAPCMPSSPGAIASKAPPRNGSRLINVYQLPPPPPVTTCQPPLYTLESQSGALAHEKSQEPTRSFAALHQY